MRFQIRTVQSSDADARYRPFGAHASDHTVDACPVNVAKQNQSSVGSSRYSLIVSSYEADARIYAMKTNVRRVCCGDEQEKMVDLLLRMPCDAFDVLGMFHEHPHTLKVSVRLDWSAREQRSHHMAGSRTHNAPSHTQTVLSRLQLASKEPDPDQATPLHSVSCPSRMLTHSHSPVPPSSSPYCPSRFQIPMFASKDAVARVNPDGDHAIPRTVLVCPVEMEVCREKAGVESAV